MDLTTIGIALGIIALAVIVAIEDWGDRHR